MCQIGEKASANHRSPSASASPSTGYTAKVAKNADWIRVDLAKAEHGTVVFCLGRERHTGTWTY
ncbi:hypothetical protein [Nonomuraea sp. SYSU D8015]|uniref:hypothetical protein n=1 Tax=Nonomuraea sp. SYSU D8015 TaxID=2593644 RepID=UPI0016603B28|nr:hypothetical protein [Nonomuraea sp. SYSU D8015]